MKIGDVLMAKIVSIEAISHKRWNDHVVVVFKLWYSISVGALVESEI